MEVYINSLKRLQDKKDKFDNNNMKYINKYTVECLI